MATRAIYLQVKRALMQWAGCRDEVPGLSSSRFEKTAFKNVSLMLLALTFSPERQQGCARRTHARAHARRQSIFGVADSRNPACHQMLTSVSSLLRLCRGSSGGFAPASPWKYQQNREKPVGARLFPAPHNKQSTHTHTHVFDATVV